MLVCLSVCHIRALCPNGRRYRHDLFCVRQLHVQDRIKIWFTTINPFLPKLCPKVAHPPVDLSIRDCRRQITAEWLEIVQRSQWRACRKPPSLFRMVASLTSMWPQSPYKRCRSKMHLTHASSRHVLLLGEYGQTAMSPVAKLPWTLLTRPVWSRC